MVTRIKRVAQFLFDNAELIAEYLQQSDNFRTVGLDLRLHKMYNARVESPVLAIELQIYDETAGLNGLENHLITKGRFTQLQQMINEDSGVTPLPEPVKVRDTLVEPIDKREEEAYNDSPEIDT